MNILFVMQTISCNYTVMLTVGQKEYLSFGVLHLFFTMNIQASYDSVSDNDQNLEKNFIQDEEIQGA